MNLFYILIAAIFCHAAMASNCTLVKTTTVVSIPAGYNYTVGFGYHKYYAGPKSWYEAREHCVKDGAHLAIPDSNEEVKLLLSKRNATSVSTFVGFHRLFNLTEIVPWITVLDQPLANLTFGPDTFGFHCGSIYEGGVQQHACAPKNDFFCEINV